MMSLRSPKSIINQFSRRLFWISSSSDIGKYDVQAIGLIFRYSEFDQLKNSRLFPKYSFKSSFEYSFVIILSSRCSWYSSGACPNVVNNQPLFHLTINQVYALVLVCLILLWNHSTYWYHFNIHIGFPPVIYFISILIPHMSLLTPLFFLSNHHSAFPFHSHSFTSQSYFSNTNTPISIDSIPFHSINH